MERKIIMRAVLFVFLIMAISISTWAQDTEKAAIVKAIETGDAATLSKYFVPTIDLMVEEVENVYSREQADQILRSFFAEHNPSSFEIKHSGKSKSNDFYYIGQLQTVQGSFRVTFFLKKSGEAFQIKQLRIENA